MTTDYVTNVNQETDEMMSSHSPRSRTCHPQWLIKGINLRDVGRYSPVVFRRSKSAEASY